MEFSTNSKAKREEYVSQLEVGDKVLIKVKRTSRIREALTGGFPVIGEVVKIGKSNIRIQFENFGEPQEVSFRKDMYSVDSGVDWNEKYASGRQRVSRVYWWCLPFGQYATPEIKEIHLKQTQDRRDKARFNRMFGSG